MTLRSSTQFFLFFFICLDGGERLARGTLSLFFSSEKKRLPPFPLPYNGMCLGQCSYSCSTPPPVLSCILPSGLLIFSFFFFGYFFFLVYRKRGRGEGCRDATTSNSSKGIFILFFKKGGKKANKCIVNSKEALQLGVPMLNANRVSQKNKIQRKQTSNKYIF